MKTNSNNNHSFFTNVESPVLFVTDTGKNLKDKYDLVDYLNEADDWPNDAEAAMKIFGFSPSKGNNSLDWGYNLTTKEYLTTEEDRNGKSHIEILDLPEDYEMDI